MTTQDHGLDEFFRDLGTLHRKYGLTLGQDSVLNHSTGSMTAEQVNERIAFAAMEANMADPFSLQIADFTVHAARLGACRDHLVHGIVTLFAVGRSWKTRRRLIYRLLVNR